MLAYLPTSGDPATPRVFCLQMNTGLRKWETTQKMPPASYPTPAQLDAYAKKIANRPLSIQIFPNTVKVPQRKHIRRTVNGLDTWWPNQHHSPDLLSTRRGLLAVSRSPSKGVITELDSSHSRHCHKAAMNPQGGTYRSTLQQPAVLLQSSAQVRAQLGHKRHLLPPQMQQQQQQQQSLLLPGSLQQPGNLVDSQHLHQLRLRHSQARQQEQAVMQVQTPQQQRLTNPQGLRSLCHTQGQQQQQRLFHSPTCESLPADQQALFTQQAIHQDLHHVPDEAALLNLQPADHLLAPPPAQAAGAPSKTANGFQQPGASEQRKPPDADVPPNVTVSTSTIPLSMASNLHQNHPGDLSSIVHHINQLCQARAGIGATSVCEGQIANPSPISRNLLINCLMVGHSDKPSAQAPSGPLQPQPTGPATVGMASFQRDSEKAHLQRQQHQQQIQQHLHRHQQLQLQQLHQQQVQQQVRQQQKQVQQPPQRSWSRHQLDQDLLEGALPCKSRRLEPPAECRFSSQTINYSSNSHQRSSAAPCELGPMTSGQPQWATAPSGHQDLPLGLQAAPVAASANGTDSPSGTKMVHRVDLFGRPVHLGAFQGPSMDPLENVQQGPVAGPVQTSGNVGVLHTDHQGFC